MIKSSGRRQMNPTIGIASCATVFCCCWLGCQNEQERNAYGHFFDRSQLILKNLDVDVGDRKATHFLYEKYRSKGKRILILYGKDFGFEYNIESGDLLEFNDKLGSRQAEGIQVKNNVGNATWSSAEVTKRALDFAKKIGIHKRFSVGERQIRRVVSTRDADTYNNTYWLVQWQRKTDGGIEFLEDYISIKISEKVGPYYFNSTMTTKYAEGAAMGAKKITKKKAIEKALKHVQPTLDNTAFSDVLPSGIISVDSKPSFAELRIVRPNSFRYLQHRGASRAFIKGKMGWVFWFECWLEEYDEAVKEERLFPAYAVSVWINSLNGEYLGGDLFIYDKFARKGKRVAGSGINGLLIDSLWCAGTGSN